MLATLPKVPWDTKPIYFNGGLDVVTPPLQIKPGFCRDTQNYEQDISGGYARSAGYERYSGLARPSDAVYAMLDATLTGTLAVGNVITGVTSGATATIIAIETSPYRLALTKITGTFVSETLNVSGTPQATCVGPQVIDGASTALTSAQYRNLAADVYRALIAAVPGSGSVLGVWWYNDSLYAFRNNAGGTAAVMHKATGSGWVAVTMPEEVSFTNADVNVGDGDTLTQGGVTATIARVVLQTGSLESGVNTGRFIITGRSGGNFAAGAATSTGSGTVTLSGAQTAVSFAVPSGRFEFCNYGFSGSSAQRMYGCDGKNRCFEFDGTTLVPIATGMTGVADAPTHICVHKNHLFVSFGNSVQHCRPGYPYQWNVIVGAGEIAMGDTVSAFQVQPGGQGEAALAIFTRNQFSILYGKTVDDWNLVPFRFESGCLPYTAQFMASSIYLDDRGLTSLAAVQAYGNFEDATISKLIQPWLRERKALAVDSCVVRAKNQYRLFFSSGDALYVTMDGGKVLGMMPQLFTHIPTCVCSSEQNNGDEVIFFGASNGMVYQMEKGTSFDGDEIDAWLNLVFCNFGSPRRNKRFRHATFEVAGDGYAEFLFSYELGYGSADIAQPGEQSITTALNPAYWDSFTWDSFTWDGTALLPARADIAGSAENLSIKIRSKSDYFDPLRVSGALIQLSMRGDLR